MEKGYKTGYVAARCNGCVYLFDKQPKKNLYDWFGIPKYYLGKLVNDKWNGNAGYNVIMPDELKQLKALDNCVRVKYLEHNKDVIITIDSKPSTELSIHIELVEFSGLVSVLTALHLPYSGKVKSDVSFKYDKTYYENLLDEVNTYSHIKMDRKDLHLIDTLIHNGDEHAKVIRGLVAYLKITAPRYWWQEMATYRIGVENLGSTSTMHTQGKGLSTEELVKMKAALPEGTENTRVLMFSYQALRRIYKQRKNHRLPQWREFCEFLETMPFSGFITD